MKIFKKAGVITGGIILTMFSWVPISRGAIDPANPELQIGIYQRFGEEDRDFVEIIAPENSWLTVTFLQDNQSGTLETNRLSIGVQWKELAQPIVQERVVLSSHRSFESAEESAQEWDQRGIPTEIAKPTNIDWEVWANRQKYDSHDSKLQLVQELHNEGFSDVFLVSDLQQRSSQLYWVSNGQRYEGSILEIHSSQESLRITEIPVPSWMAVATNGMLFPGWLKVQPNAYGSYTIVNNVQLEDYLRGVVPSEMLPNAAFAAVESQATIARTYALRNLRRFQIDGYQLCADTHCQVYTGWHSTTSLADQAVRSTRGQVLTYRGELIDALYSSTTGGVTATFEDMWNGQPRPYLRSTVDSQQQSWNLSMFPLNIEENLKRFIALNDGFTESGSQFFRWRVETTLTDLTNQFRRYLQRKRNSLQTFQKLESIAVIERSLGGRVLKTKIITDQGEITVNKEEIMYVFNAPNSTLFYLEPITDQDNRIQKYAFIGGGYGHGIGLSQVGAARLASLGWSSSKILDFYYPGARLEQLTPDIIYWQPPKN